MKKERIVALVGNPNVGKSTVFNEITGESQHTGNWTGKTVALAEGKYYYKYNDYHIYDLPGIYSLVPSSAEEEIARSFIEDEEYDCLVCVLDSTNLERNLNLVFQVAEVTNKFVVLLNLEDEAKKKNICINRETLSKILGVPVIEATARSGKGINQLLESVHSVVTGSVEYTPLKVTYISFIEQALSLLKNDTKSRFEALRVLQNPDEISEENYKLLNASIKAQNLIEKYNFTTEFITESITSSVVQKSHFVTSSVELKTGCKKEKKNFLDKILLGKYTSGIAMILMFGIVLWITIVGSNYPSNVLMSLFNSFEDFLEKVMQNVGISTEIISFVDHGILRVLLWVVAVMLPPMTIFFPIFALMEDFGILPRIAFNLDPLFERCGACGKQSLTTCMGYGCNAVGVTGARIIDSDRERILAIVTNSLSPCNGRFPLLIAIIAMFFSKNSFLSAVILLSFILLSMAMTLLSSKILTKTSLKGKNSSFVLELPPYRKPQIVRTVLHTLKEKVLFVLMRAVVVAAPAGIVIWILANVKIGDNSVIFILSRFLDPVGKIIGLDGVMLLAFILGFPANEIVIPIALMTYLSKGEMSDYSSLIDLKNVLVSNGWTSTTAICTTVFSMFHFPCSTTLLTIWKETKSVKWTFLSVMVPLLTGVILCSIINLVF